MSTRFIVRTFGCQMNEHDSERLAGLLIADGLEPAEDLEDADLVVFNTCCIRENADNRLYGELGRLKELSDRKPDLKIAVGGCLAQKDRQLLRERAPHVDVVFGTHNLTSAPELIRRSDIEGPIVEIIDSSARQGSDPGLGIPAKRESSYSAWVNIQTGCDNSCAFCIVPSVRGREVSRAVDDVLSEVSTLARRGVVEITLLGQNVNSYGRDITKRSPLFAQLLRSVGAVAGIERVRFTSPHPKDIRPETIAAMAEVPTICPQLHLPLQSGSNRVLKAMRRGYTAERYLSRLEAAREAIDDLAVTTDIIVGFPGETDDDFEATLQVVAEARYDSAFTFIFSPRQGTRAAEMTDSFVPAAVVGDRFERLRVAVERSALVANQRRIGRVERVLIEGPSRKDASVLAGRSAQGKLVHFLPPPTICDLGSGGLADVQITRAAPHHLTGDFVSAVPRAAPKRRIPVSVR
ncbi:MAG: tRNA (N6-isopentenyl adenosine(37)-C2)-methylthiotransferase MiaB [Acidimicrobiales bacterium]